MEIVKCAGDHESLMRLFDDPEFDWESIICGVCGKELKRPNDKPAH